MLTRPKTFLQRVAQHHNDTDVFAVQIEEKLDKDFDLRNTRQLMIDVVRLLLNECENAREKGKKADIAILIFHFFLYYPKMFNEACSHEKFLCTITNKLIEFSIERRAGFMVRGRLFMEDETREMIRLLREKGRGDLATHLQDEIEIPDIYQANQVEEDEDVEMAPYSSPVNRDLQRMDAIRNQYRV